MAKLNTGMLAAALIALVALDAIYRYPETTDWFRLGCLGVGALAGGWAWVSGQRWGVWIGRGSKWGRESGAGRAGGEKAAEQADHLVSFPGSERRLS